MRVVSDFNQKWGARGLTKPLCGPSPNPESTFAMDLLSVGPPQLGQASRRPGNRCLQLRCETHQKLHWNSSGS